MFHVKHAARKFSDRACLFRKFWRGRASAKVKYFFEVTREKFSCYIALTLVSYARTVPTLHEIFSSSARQSAKVIIL